MEAYIVPDWLTIIAGLVISRRKVSEQQVLFGLRSARAEEGKWCLPTGLGAIRRDISDVLALGAPASLKYPLDVIVGMSDRHKQAFTTPAGFALAEARWYIDIPQATIEQLVPLKPICQLDGRSLLVKIYFWLDWQSDELPKPAKTEWPFKEIKFFSKEDLKNVPVAFGCDKDLEDAFWPSTK
ncbi:MAG: hypothetical protein ABIG29_02445 [Candidatus Nealsonbacteria bacterium]